MPIIAYPWVTVEARRSAETLIRGFGQLQSTDLAGVRLAASGEMRQQHAVPQTLRFSLERAYASFGSPVVASAVGRQTAISARHGERRVQAARQFGARSSQEF